MADSQNFFSEKPNEIFDKPYTQEKNYFYFYFCNKARVTYFRMNVTTLAGNLNSSKQKLRLSRNCASIKGIFA